MSLLRKLFNRKNQEYVKGDVKIYIQCIDDTVELKKDSYVMAGVFNEDGTAFKDILTGEVVRDLQSNDVSIRVEEKYYEKLDDVAHEECESGVGGLVDVHVMHYAKGCKVKQDFVEGRILDRYYINLEYEKGMNHILAFLLKDENDRVSIDEIKKVVKALNKIVYKNHKTIYNNVEGSMNNQLLRSCYKNF